MLIGILSDTHLPGRIRSLDELGPQPSRFFAKVDLILHSGDLTSPTVLDWCEKFAPVLCSTGNNDPIKDHRMTNVVTFNRCGWAIGMRHSLERQLRPIEELQRLFPSPVDIMISGHTHQERLEYRDGVVLINTGSITFPQHKEVRLGTVGLLNLERDILRAEIIPLGHSAGNPNPGTSMSIEIIAGNVTITHGPVIVTSTDTLNT